jgi:hypothetical protein
MISVSRLYSAHDRTRNDYGAVGGMELARVTCVNVFEENLFKGHNIEQKSHMTRNGIEPEPQRWKARDKPV